MTRQQKYPETGTFHYHNQNPKNRLTGDCIIRAISRAMGLPYERVLFELAYMSSETGYSMGDKKNIDKYMEYYGWKRFNQPKFRNGKKYTGDQFCIAQQSILYGDGNTGNWEIYPSDRIVAKIGGHHIVAIVDGKVNDTWDSTDGCIGVYWAKP